MKNIKSALKIAKREGKTSIKLNSSSEELTREIQRIVLDELAPLSVESAKNSVMVICLKHPEWKCRGIRKTEYGYEVGRGYNTKMVFEENLKDFACVDNLPYGLDWAEVF